MQAPGQKRFSRRSKLTAFFGLKRNLVILLIAIFVIGAGEELWMRFVPKYLQALGATVFVIGFYDALRTLLGAVYAYPGGIIVDHWGHRRAFIIFNVVSIVGYSLVLLIPNWGGVIAGMFFFLSWSCFSLPATFSLVGAALEANRHSMGIGVQSVIKRLPIMVAPILGGMLIDHFGIIPGVRIALVVSIFLSALTIFVQRQFREDSVESRVVAVPPPAAERWSLWRSLASIQSADETFVVKRHFDSFLRTSSLCVDRDFCDGLHRHERSASGDSHDNRNARRRIVYHSRLALRRSIWARALRDCDLCHVHAFSDQLVDVAQFFRAGHRVYDPRVERIRRYVP